MLFSREHETCVSFSSPMAPPLWVVGFPKTSERAPKTTAWNLQLQARFRGARWSEDSHPQRRFSQTPNRIAKTSGHVGIRGISGAFCIGAPACKRKTCGDYLHKRSSVQIRRSTFFCVFSLVLLWFSLAFARRRFIMADYLRCVNEGEEAVKRRMEKAGRGNSVIPLCKGQNHQRDSAGDDPMQHEQQSRLVNTIVHYPGSRDFAKSKKKRR
jgi:hypothetical protein